jgi:CubicO group peptidase (beta-lactamase class C family)
MDAAALRIDLDRALAGVFVPGSDAGAAIGVLDGGERRIFTYGAALPDSLFEIGSISKTFTGVMLAQLVSRGTVTLNDPLRELLPAGTVAPPRGREISLLDLATHRSGLPRMPDNFRPRDRANPAADYRRSDLFAFLSRHGVRKPGNAPVEYSNLGFAALGEALAYRVGMPYEELLRREITRPLRMVDTVILLPDRKRARFLTGIDIRERPVAGWDLGAFAPAGGIRSTAGDMLAYLDAQLHPERIEGPLRESIRLSQRVQADITEDLRIALGWIRDSRTGAYWHNGGTGGYSSYAFFQPEQDRAAVVLLNQNALTLLADSIGDRLRQRMAGEPAISLDRIDLPESGGFPGLLRAFAAYWLTMLAAGAFIYCSVLAVQGITAQLLPRRWFLRASSFLQLAAFAGFVGIYMVQPNMVGPGAILAAQNHGLLYWSPSYWFLGLFQQLNGSPALGPLAQRAWIGLAISVALAATAYLFSYLRSLRQIAEEPDIVAGVPGVSFLPRFGDPLATAVTRFSVRTLLRSRQHRLILAFYWGLALAFVLFIVKTPGVQRQLAGHEDPWFEPNVPLIVASILVLCASIVGIRVVAAMPRELAANWVFRVTPVPAGRPSRIAVRRAFYVLGLTPVWILSAVVFLSIWPWPAGAVHVLALALLGIALAEIALSGFFKIPFTCSYLPGKARVNMAVLGYLGLVLPIVTVARIERNLLRDWTGSAILLGVLAGAALTARWWSNSHGAPPDHGLRFEDEPDPAIYALDLHRDGTSPVSIRSSA